MRQVNSHKHVDVRNMNLAFSLRLAREADVAELEILISASVRGLQPAYYSPHQIEAALGTAFAVDRQLIRDGTYFVVQHTGRIVGCGGWSRRRALYGGDHGRCGENPALDPTFEPARIRAFFVHPAWARRGIGRAILHACEAAIVQGGFRRVILMATLAGEPLYAACEYVAVDRAEIRLPCGIMLPVVQMTKDLVAVGASPGGGRPHTIGPAGADALGPRSLTAAARVLGADT
jgi:GNAT superfamily N-acetyltransferase